LYIRIIARICNVIVGESHVYMPVRESGDKIIDVADQLDQLALTALARYNQN
jgi:hypothetical protein